MIDSHQETKAYLVGAGIGSLAAAVFLIRDGGLKGENVHILEELPIAGGSLDGTTLPNVPDGGYVTRGGRMLTEEAYVCLWNLLETIPSLEDPSTSVKDETWKFNAKWKSNSKARLIDENHAIVDASDLQLNARDRAEFARLLATPERVIGARRIEDFFSDHFFRTNFWYMWRTTFAFQNWHSAIELKRYSLRFIQELPRFHTLGGVRRTKYNQYDSVVRPIERWLAERGAKVEYGVRVEDADFGTDGHGERRLERLHVTRDARHDTIELGADGYAFLTLGSMTADATYGDGDSVPELIRDKRDGGWRLWEAIAPKAPDFGRPNVFNGNVDEAKWESFTLTMHSPLLLHRIVEFSGNLPGTGGLMTFKDSSWLMSIVVPHQPHFAGQPEDVFTLWGYALFIDNEGDYVKKKFSEATGQEILTELVHQLGFEDALEEIRRTTSVVTVMMPYITSQFERRQPEDRPQVVPKGSRNFAFLGQYAEVPEDVVFTVEYSVRGAMHGVYGLLSIDKEIPGIYHGLLDPKVALPVLKTSFG